MPNITQNPDYQLVMKFLQNIRPGDMDQESSQQLMMIGQRIQSGGALSDREREMFQAVVGNMPQTEMMDPGSAVREGEAAMGMAGPGMSPEMMADMVAQGQKSAIDGMTDAQRAIMQNKAYNRRLAEEMAMPSKDGMNYSPSSGVTMEPNVMTMEEAVDAGLVTPTRPRMRPAAPMQSPRPQARPMR